MSEFNIDQFIQILPKLIRENDAVKGAILSALSGVVATREDIKDLIHEMDKRFEAMQTQMDKRFNAMDKRFSAMDKRFEAMQTQMDKRFESLERSMLDLSLSVRRMESKGGYAFENIVLELMKETLKLENIDVNTLRNEPLQDKQGKVFFPNYKSDIDVIAENGNTYLVEVKSKADPDDIAHFMQNVKLFEITREKKVTTPILIALRISERTRVLAQNLGIRVITGEIITSD